MIVVMKLEAMKNLGPASASMLARAGIHSVDELKQAGAVGAYLQVIGAGGKPSLNLLWAIEGALTNCHWANLPAATRSALLLELDARSGGDS